MPPWIGTAWTWLQDNQGPLVAIGTVALVVVTVVYVIKTGALARSAERSAASAERLVQLEVLPLAYARRGGHSKGAGRQQSIQLVVKNVGPAAALNVYGWFRIGEETEDGYQTFGSVLMTPILDPGTHATRGVEITDEQGQAFEQDPSPVYCIAQFSDGFGGTYKTEWQWNEISLFELVGQGPPRWEQINRPKHLPTT